MNANAVAQLKFVSRGKDTLMNLLRASEEQMAELQAAGPTQHKAFSEQQTQLERYNHDLSSKGSTIEQHLKSEAGQVINLARISSQHVARIQQLTECCQQVVKAKDDVQNTALEVIGKQSQELTAESAQKVAAAANEVSNLRYELQAAKNASEIQSQTFRRDAEEIRREAEETRKSSADIGAAMISNQEASETRCQEILTEAVE